MKNKYYLIHTDNGYAVKKKIDLRHPHAEIDFMMVDPSLITPELYTKYNEITYEYWKLQTDLKELAGLIEDELS